MSAHGHNACATALTPSSFQIGRIIVAIQTLKRRKHHIRGEVPIPPELMAALDRQFGSSARNGNQRLSPF
ncbi:MAG TPA: hypothetical protein VN920_07660 [Pyrinomonadaceae bacterium]|nr:hypothetical protein [Pyrinomonadaceae bacterium]